MTELQEKRCREILRYYGAEKQRRQLVEECAELIQAVCKLHREYTPHSYYNFIEELADVEIMVEQMKQILPTADRDRLGEIETAKINRQLRRIARGEK